MDLTNYLTAQTYFSFKDENKTAKIKRTKSLNPWMYRRFPVSLKEFIFPEEYEVPQEFLDEAKIWKPILQFLKQWQDGWCTLLKDIQKEIKLPETQLGDAVLKAIDECISSYEVLTDEIDSNNFATQPPPLNIWNKLWGELRAYDVTARHLVTEFGSKPSFESFTTSFCHQKGSNDGLEYQTIKELMLKNQKTIMDSVANRRIIMPESVRDCTEPVKKVDLLATSRVEIRQLAKRSAEGAFLADNIIKLWKLVNSLNVESEEIEDSFEVFHKVYRNIQKSGEIEPFYEELKELTETLATELQELLPKKVFSAYTPLPKIFKKLQAKAQKAQEMEPVRRSHREKKLKKHADEEFDQEKENNKMSKNLKFKKQIKKETEEDDETEKNPVISEKKIEESEQKAEEPIKKKEEAVETTKKRGRPSRTKIPKKPYSPPHTSEDKSEDIPNSDEEEETLADKSSDELEEIMTDNENDESEELSEEEESSEAEDTDDEYRVPVKRRRRSEPSSNKSMLKRYRMESPEKEIPYREQQVTEKDLVLINERIFLETTKLHLYACRYNDGSFFLKFIPTLVGHIDTAIEALNAFELEDYVMRKAAVEAGVLYLYKMFNFKPPSPQDVYIQNELKIMKKHDQSEEKPVLNQHQHQQQPIYNQDGYRELQLEQL